jgi:MFS family permease
VLAGAFTLSGVAGPILGGFVSDEISWRWLFWFNLPLGIAALWFLLRIFPKIAREHRSRRLDITGGLTFGLFATSALFAVTFGGDKYAWDSPIIIGLFLFALLNIGLFVRAEFRAEDPVLPPELFRHRIFAGAMASSLTVTISFVVTTVFVPLLVIGAKGESATTSAFPLMAEAIGIAIGANFAGQILSRFGYARELAVTGLTLTATILWSIGIIGIDISINQLAILSLAMGIGISLAFTSFTVQVQNSMPENVLGVVTTSMQFARTFSMATSSAILGAILLAGIGFINTDDPTPQDVINNPEIIVAERRLADVRLDYLDDPNLGESAFEHDLSAARKKIGHALSTVFQVAAIGSAVGVLLAVYTFSDMRTEDPN